MSNDKIQALIEAGRGATQGEWVINGNTINYDADTMETVAVVSYGDDMNFITQAANARPEIIAMYEANQKQAAVIEVMREALESDYKWDWLTEEEEEDPLPCMVKHANIVVKALKAADELEKDDGEG